MHNGNPFIKIVHNTLIASALCLLISCGGNAPIDAETRIFIDSTANARIFQAQKELDSLCRVQEKELMPYLIDSIKQVRLREIERQLKTIPKH